MKKIEVKLSLPVVAPLLDVIKSTVDDLRGSLAAAASGRDIDEDLREVWVDALLVSQAGDCRTLLGLFDREFFSTGVIAFDGTNAEPIVRSCAAVRLRLREKYLKTLEDESLESGNIELETLPEPERKAFMCYLFLATIQELIIQHLDSSIIES
ncbi:MAG TPA: hypothetical protein VNW30_12210 [Opitutaceae bacterium]|jgi:hypothetical protein|nr:hypothetical protein [Opitutaceae bacterium]